MERVLWRWPSYFDSGTLGYAGPPGSAPFNQYDYVASTTYGGFAGYNIQRNNLVFGAEVACNSGGVAYANFPDDATNYLLDLKGRVGFSVGSALLYGVVGYSTTEWATSDTYVASGLSYGVGLDYMIGEHLFLGAEYLVRDMNGTRADNSSLEGQSDLQSAALRVGWKF